MATTKTSKPKVAAATPLMEYQLFTNPEPVQVSSAQKTQNVVINNATKGGASIYCNQVVIGIPHGTDAVSLTDVKPTGAVNTTKWTLASSTVKKGTDIGLNTVQPYYVFTFQTVSSADNKIDYELVFGIEAQVNEAVGTSEYILFEFSGTTKDTTKFTKKQAKFPVQKTVQQFYLKNFAAAAPAAPTQPLTEFSNGDDIRFSWESSGNYFEVYVKGDTTPIYAGTSPAFLMKGGVSVDSTFFLVATASGVPTSGGSFEPIQLYDALTITIKNPDLTPKTITASGDITTKGSVTAGGLMTSGGIHTNGSITLSKAASGGGALVITNNPNDNKVYLEGYSSDLKGSADGMYVSGKDVVNLPEVGISADKTNLSGALDVKGTTTLENILNVSGLATLSGGLNGTGGTVSLMENSTAVTPGKYTAKTDGFVAGYVSRPSDIKNLCVTAVVGTSGGAGMRATGGTCAALNSGGSLYYMTNMNSFLLPVKNGNIWEISVDNAPKNQVNAPTYFWWIPMGTAPSGNTYEKLSDNVSEKHLRFGSANEVVHNTEQPGDTIEQLMSLIEKIMGKKIDEKLKEEFARIIVRL